MINLIISVLSVALAGCAAAIGARRPIKGRIMKKYVCEICGHIHEGELSELPNGCPVCGADVDQFTEEL